MFLYVCLLVRVGCIAKKCDRTFPALLMTGIALLLVTQALFNMMVAVGLAPVTGQPLPLISNCLLYTSRSAIDSTTNVIPPVKAGEMNEALLVLNDLKVPVQKQFAGQKKKEQWGHTQAAPSARCV